MNFGNPYWSMQTKIELLEKWILVHSYLYYEEDNGIVPDAMFDNNCRQLRAYCRANRSDFQKSKYYRAFGEYIAQESNSGYWLYKKLNYKEKAIIRRDAMICANMKR